VTAYQALPLATIQQLDPMYVDVAQSTAELLGLRRRLEAGRVSEDSPNGREVRITLEDGSIYPLPGKLQFRDVTSVDPATGSYILRIVAPNPDHLLLPGMFVRAEIMEGVLQNAVLVPQQGVTRNTKGEAVAFIVDDDNTARQRKLIIDRAIGNQWLVTSGLSAGDRLIVEGRLNVRPDKPVTAVSVDVKPRMDPGRKSTDEASSRGGGESAVKRAAEQDAGQTASTRKTAE
jgi:membrane fusion protein (multidrug efflux system)